MTLSEVYALVRAELAAFTAAADKREHVQTRAVELFDQFVEPIDLPGPDPVIDPILRMSVKGLAGVLFDAAVERLKDTEE